MTTPIIDFSQVVPPDFLKKLASTFENHKFGAILVISNEALAELNQNKSAMLAGHDGSCIILVPQSILEEIYK